MKYRKLLAALLLLLACVSAYAQAPEGVELDVHELTLDLAAEDPTATLTAAVLPEGNEANLRWSVSDDKVLSCEDGRLTALRRGKAVVTVRAGDRKDTCSVTVINSSYPDRIVAYPSSIELEPFQTRKLECVSLPGTASNEYRYRSGNTKVASVDENGLVTAGTSGSTRITVTSTVDSRISVVIPVTVQYGKRITGLSFASPTLTLGKGETAYCGLVREPADASRAIYYKSSDEEVVSVDEDGMLTALRCGKSQITAISHRNTAISATMWVMVTDSLYPTAIVCDPDGTILMNVGQETELSVSMLPEGCDDGYAVTSTHIDIVRAEGTTLKALKRGMAVITIHSLYNDKLHKDITVMVQDGTGVLEMPLRRTDEDGIEENVARIRAIKEYTLQVLASLYDDGSIDETEYRRRVGIVENAFDMYDFVWTVDEVQKYWSPANSEGGAKDFKPGIFYYGLPYSSSLHYDHNYNVEKALDQGRYVPVEGKNYYLLKKKPNTPSTNYAGNNCSAFVSLALWKKTVNSGSIYNTNVLRDSYSLATYFEPERLKAGDILVCSGEHVVMFLYFADEEKTQAVFIQQGGSEPGINTVNTFVQDISYYLDNDYRMRHLRTYDEE